MTTQPSTCACKVCGRAVKVTKSGRLALHGYSQRGATNSVGCQGSVYFWNTTYADIANHCESIAPSWAGATGASLLALAKKMRMKAASETPAAQ
jgi:hypothetical protein